LINDTSFGTGLDHSGNHIVWETLYETIRDAVFENFGGGFAHSRFHNVVEFYLKLLRVAGALADFLFNMNTYRVVKSHTFLLAVKGVFWEHHICVFLNVGVKVFLRLEDNSTRVIQLLN